MTLSPNPMRVILLCALLSTSVLCAEEAPPDVILDEKRVEMLGITTAETESGTFEDKVFALGRIEAMQGRRAVVSMARQALAWACLSSWGRTSMACGRAQGQPQRLALALLRSCSCLIRPSTPPALMACANWLR